MGRLVCAQTCAFLGTNPNLLNRAHTPTPAQIINHKQKPVAKPPWARVLAPNAKLRKAVIETGGPSGVTLKLLTEAREKMELSEAGNQSEDNQQGRVRKLAARCWAMLLARIYECLPLTCPKCGQPMRLIAFIMEPVVVEKMESLRDPAKAMTIAYRGAD